MLEIFTAAFWEKYGSLLLDGTVDTLIMVVISTLFAYLIGLPLGVLLILTGDHGIWPHKNLNRILTWIINIGRSLPFIILMIAIMDFTKLLVGTKIGVRGAIVPLVVSAAPFIDQILQKAREKVWKVYLPEAKPSLVLGGAISVITILAYTAIAGAVGAGGLGDLAIRYGYNRKVPSMMLVTVIFLIVLVQIIQFVFSRVSNRIDKRLK